MKQKLLFLLTALLLPAGAMAQFAWYGENGKAQVVTGLGNGSNTEGLWWWTDEIDNGGCSASVVWDVEPGEDGNLDNLVKECGGISGTAVLEKYPGWEHPNVELIFNVVGLDANGEPQAGDASAWGGIALSYSCETNIRFFLGLKEDYCIDPLATPVYELPAAPEGNFVRIPWSEFKQPSWVKNVSYISKISGPDAAKQLVSLRLKITTYKLHEHEIGNFHFNIKAIGSYDMDETPVGILNEDAVTEVAAVPVLIQSEGGTISVQGAAAGTPIAVYDLEGREYGFTVAEKDRAVIPTSLRTGSTAIVKIGGKAVKVLVK